MKFSKIWAMIPRPIYEEIHRRKLFANGDFDEIVTELLLKYLEESYGITKEQLGL